MAKCPMVQHREFMTYTCTLEEGHKQQHVFVGVKGETNFRDSPKLKRYHYH